MNQRQTYLKPAGAELSYLDKKNLKNERLSQVWCQISKAAYEQDY